jgi:DNA-binding GntR family transcriptional regulator
MLTKLNRLRRPTQRRSHCHARRHALQWSVRSACMVANGLDKPAGSRHPVAAWSARESMTFYKSPRFQKTDCKTSHIGETDTLTVLSEMLDLLMLDTQSPFLNQDNPDGASFTERQLRSAIVTLTLAPGARLSEIELCRLYGQGRGIVRAALNTLAHDGFVVSQPRSGWKISPISAAGLREIILARGRLESLLADAQTSDDDLTRIQTICDMQAAIRAAPSILSFEHAASQRRYDRQIREILAERLKAPLIAAWLGNLWDKSERYLRYFESSGLKAAPRFDWAPFVDAKRRADDENAGHILQEGCAAFARFAQASLLESNLAAPDAFKTTRPKTERLRQPPRLGERSSKRTI